MAPNPYEELRQIIGPDQRGLVIIHPDPDSLASAWALASLFRKSRSGADIAICEPIKRLENRSMVKLLRIPLLNFKEVQMGDYSRLCLVDAQPSQFPDIKPDKWHVVIDHHPLHPECPCEFTDIRPQVGATSTIMTQYLDAAKVRIGEKLATALCYGIITDTDYFQRNMTREDAMAFSSLFPKVNYRLLKVIEQTEIPSRQLQFFDQALHRLSVKSRRAIVHIGATESADIAVILADFFIRVAGIQFVAFSCIAMDRLIIVFRSRSMKRDAGRIADSHFSELGSAGGHKSAARAEVPLENVPPEVKLYSPDSVESFIRKRLSQPGKRAQTAG